MTVHRILATAIAALLSNPHAFTEGSVLRTTPEAEVRLQVTQLDGQSYPGSLTRITEQFVVVESDGDTREVPVDSVMMLEFPEFSRPQNPDESSSQPETMEVSLHDGSVLHSSGVIRTPQSVELAGTTLGSCQIPVSAVRAVQFQSRDATTAAQWSAFLKRDGPKDLLIIPKRDGTGLDFLAGIVASISEDNVSFLLDGDTIPVPRERVFGIVFAKAKDTGLNGSAVLYAGNKQRVGVSEVRYSEKAFHVMTSWGQRLSFDADQVARIDFSTGRIQYLSDLDPLQVQFDGIDPDGELFAGLIDDATAEKLYGLRRDSTLDPRRKIRLRGRRFDKGLCLHSRTTVSYALDQKYQSFEATVGVDDEVAFNQISQVLLKISADGKVLFEKQMITSDEPVSVSLPVSNMTTLVILVDYGDSDSSCDWVDLADAKLILATEGK
ncbi:MAG: NPCBM/NEW2 domain-containing protein [Planctomycetaceae bacterium]|nr:NPCBM/NEW2 domain-containing protein [Planctomycetaceae bacterium]